jgi:hypothetical protein
MLIAILQRAYVSAERRAASSASTTQRAPSLGY